MGAPHRTTNDIPLGLAPFVRENSEVALVMLMYLFMVSVTMWSFTLAMPGPLLYLRAHMVATIIQVVCWF